jgi:hypothetical protein
MLTTAWPQFHHPNFGHGNSPQHPLYLNTVAVDLSLFLAD